MTLYLHVIKFER